jgi:hypothetical protein
MSIEVRECRLGSSHHLKSVSGMQKCQSYTPKYQSLKKREEIGSIMLIGLPL